MAMGYLGSSSEGVGDEMELRGQDYFEDLAMRSLFQDFERGSDGRTKSCKMHDIVHDFAQFLRNNAREVVIPEMNYRQSCKVCDPILVSRVKEYRSLIWDKETPPNNCECLARLIRVLRFEKKLIGGGPERMETMIHLQWLDINGTKLSKEDLKRICKLYFLQTLLLQGCFIEEIPSEIGNLVKMRYLDLSRNGELKKLPDSICGLLQLQALLLGNCFIEEIPSEIGNLVKMRFLDLSHNRELKELPDTICRLLQLQTLNVERCENLGRCPEGIYRLDNLKHLFLWDTLLSGCFAQELGELTGLRTLSGFYGGSGRSKLGLLKKLNSLTGSLTLKIKVSGSCDLDELVGDAVEAELKNKIHLREIYIIFQKDESTDEEEPSSSSSSSLRVDIIEALEPYHKVQNINLWNYKGCRLPHWISSPVNHVRKIDLRYCPLVSSLPSLGKLSFLESLIMDGVLGVKVVGAEWLGIRKTSTAQEQHNSSSSSSSTNISALVAFPKLTYVTFFDFMSWEVWEDITAEEEESEAIQIMPSLVTLEIAFCPKLKKLPHRLLRKALSLQQLTIRCSEELKKYYENDEDGNSTLRSISPNNAQLEVSIK